MATYLVSDTHFGHAGVIQFCRRPFSSVDEMNHTMIESWNAVVRPEDTVIHLGDFAYRYDAAKLPKLFASLQGQKHLIAGNHDVEARALPWASVRDLAFLSIDSQRLVLCHYPLTTWPGVRRGTIMLYGHTHGRLAGNQQSMDVGVDVFGFAPVRLNEVKSRLAKLPPRVDPEEADVESRLPGPR